jgi:hypothetical protein
VPNDAMTMEEMAAMVGDLDTPALAAATPGAVAEPVMAHAGVIAPVAAAPAPAAAPAATVSGLKVYVDVNRLRLDLQINPNDLDDATISQAPMFIHYAEQAAWARRQMDKCKLAAEVTESQVDAAWRKKFADDGTKVTETMVANAVKSDPRVIKAKTQTIEARALFDIANDSREAFMQRKDMIVQVSVDRRRERDGQLRILNAKDAEISTNASRADALAAEAARRKAA